MWWILSKARHSKTPRLADIGAIVPASKNRDGNPVLLQYRRVKVRVLQTSLEETAHHKFLRLPRDLAERQLAAQLAYRTRQRHPQFALKSSVKTHFESLSDISHCQLFLCMINRLTSHFNSFPPAILRFDKGTSCNISRRKSPHDREESSSTEESNVEEENGA